MASLDADRGIRNLTMAGEETPCTDICYENSHDCKCSVSEQITETLKSSEQFKLDCANCDRLALQNIKPPISVLEQIAIVIIVFYFNLIDSLITGYKAFKLRRAENSASKLIVNDIIDPKQAENKQVESSHVFKSKDTKPLLDHRWDKQLAIYYSCCFYCFTSSLESELSNLATNKIIGNNQSRLSKWTPEYWQTMGSFLGCLIAGISLCYMGRRASLQKVAVPVLSLAFIFTYLSASVLYTSWFLHIAILQIFIQSMSESLSIIIPAIYILETICWHPGSSKSRAIAALLALTQVPQALANILASTGLIDIHLYGAFIPVTLIIITSVLLKISPESPRWLLQAKNKVNEATKSMKLLWSGNPLKYNIDKEIGNMQRELQGIISVCTSNAYIRPLLVLSFFLLLSQSVGYGAFHFYTNWAYRLAGFTVDSKAMTSIIRLFATCLSTLASILFPGPKCTCIALLITTPVLMICLLTTGIFTYALEQGSIQTNDFVMLPITVLFVYEFAFWYGIGTFAVPTCTLIMPPKSRPIVLTIGVIIYQIASYFRDIFLPLMINVLHPYGVFWFHAFLTGVTLMYISFVIVPELKWTATCLKDEEKSDIIL